MVKIRLQRRGARNRPCYRVVAIDERDKRDGRALEFLGTYDPKQNLLVIKAENLATLIKVVPKQDAKTEDAQPPKDYLTRALVGTPYKVEGEIFQSPLGIPCTPPPWGTLTAIDLDSGKVKWQIPLGQVRRAGVTIPEGTGWGSPNVGGPIATAGGVTFIGACRSLERNGRKKRAANTGIATCA